MILTALFYGNFISHLGVAAYLFLENFNIFSLTSTCVANNNLVGYFFKASVKIYCLDGYSHKHDFANFRFLL